MGVTVTFVAILELMREGLIDIVQAEPFAPLHVRGAAQGRNLRLVADNSAEMDAGAHEPAESGSGETALETPYADEPPSTSEEVP